MLDELRYIAVAHIQAAAMARALTGSGEVPDWFEIRDRFDTALAQPPERVDTEQQALLIAIGLRGVS
jgi:hypothetical protein